MSFDFAQLFHDNSVPYWTEGNNVSENWVNVNCVFCDDSSNHLGFSEEGACACWRCGNHSTSDAIMLLTGQDWQNIQTSYSGGATHYQRNDQSVAPPSFLSLPIGTGPMNDAQKEYLIQRNFDPDKLAQDYHLQGTGIVGPYKFRIIIPIYHKGRMVSFQGRDYTGRSELRYKTCGKDQELIHHKHVLYNSDSVPGDSVVVVEGVTDAWRLGAGAVATFGVGYTQAQLLFLASFRRVFLLYDPDAQSRALKLAFAIDGLGPEAELIFINMQDPAEMKQDDADHLMKELLG